MRAAVAARSVHIPAALSSRLSSIFLVLLCIGTEVLGFVAFGLVVWGFVRAEELPETTVSTAASATVTVGADTEAMLGGRAAG